MTYPDAERILRERRFDLTPEEVCSLLADRHTLHGTGAFALHHELVEQCIDALFDLFSLASLPADLGAHLVADVVHDWPGATPAVQAAMIASLNALAQAHPVRAWLAALATPSAEAVIRRLGREPSSASGDRGEM